MGEVGDVGQWLRADATKSNRASTNSFGELLGDSLKGLIRVWTTFLMRKPHHGKNSGAEPDKCGICSTEVVNRGVLDCCNHWFCFACIDDWATVTNLCPLCKSRFRFITCLPVGYGDPNNPDNIGAGFAKRVDGSADDEGNFPFSFPSYFIDEEAVVCLEGDACLVRAGMPAPEVEGALAADTSVACDLCDCWYHAGCVNFDPDQSSFYCPRCIASQEKPKNSWNAVESGSRISSEARASSLVGLLPAEKELSYGAGTLLGSTSVAIAVAEKGESAVSISMRRIPVHPSAHQSSLSKREDSKEVMWSPIREPVNASQSYGPVWSPIREPLNISENFELWSPTPGPVTQDANNEELWSPTPASQDENDEELWSPTPESERASGSIFKEKPTVASVDPVKSIAPSDFAIQSKTFPEVSTYVGSVAPAVGPHLSKRPSTIKSSDIASVEIESRTNVSPTLQPSKTPDGFASPVGMQKDERALIDPQTAMEQYKKGKRKTLQEDERRIDSKDLPEPPRKVARKSAKKSDSSESRTLAVANDTFNKLPAEETIVDDKTADSQGKDLSSAVVITDTSKMTAEETATEEIADDRHQGHLNEAEKQKTPELEMTSHVDVMDIVSNPRERSNIQGGVRTRIIMHRETDANDAVGSGLVDRIRQQMKATAGYIKGEDLSKVEVSDDRFVAAFKAALLSSREKSKESKPTASRQGKALWLAKVLNQKSQGKGSRDSLTRKLYAGGTGRWDRDWDIAFWKERSAHLRRAQKEVEDETKSVGRTGKHVAGNKQPEEEDSIFSRIYVADTSLFPRNDDVQLLSAKAKDSAEDGGKRAVKAPEVSFDKDSLQRTSSTCKDGSIHGKGLTLGVNGKASVGLGGKLGSSPKLSTKSGLVQSQVSSAVITPPPESTTLKTDVKKDKRQWALDVLARKTGSSSNASFNTPGSAKATGCPDNGEGQFDLLLQLPLDMRPLLQHNGHSKVPTAVRQVQLNRLVEQELKSAQLEVIQKSPECEEAVNRAKAREEELYKKSNSKGVYVNLCVRSLKNGPAAKLKQETEVDHSDAIQKALEATGLVESPVASPSHGQDDYSTASTSKEGEVPDKNSGDKVKNSGQEKGVDNVLEMGTLDIFGDFEFNLDNDLEDTTLSEKFQSTKLEAATTIADSDRRIKKMTVVLSTASNVALEPSKAPSVTLLETPHRKEVTQDRVTTIDPRPTPEVSAQTQPQMAEDKDLYRELESRLPAVPTSSTDTILPPKNRSVHSRSSPSIAPSKENPRSSPPNQGFKPTSKTAEGPEKNTQNLSDGEKSQSPIPPVIQNMDDWMNSGKFADLDRRIENIRQSTSPSANTDFEVPWNSNLASVELATQNDVHNSQQSVQKQVEIYVNQHLKPLYRSGVIKADQFRYAVSKTAAKVMEHHGNATSAEFLITEGSKVRKLADQYLQNFTKRKAK